MPIAALMLFALPLSAFAADKYDVLIRNGTIYDGSGNQPYVGTVGIKGDVIVAVGEVAADAEAKTEVDAKGMAVTPGFINMLSWSNETE